MGLMNDRQKKSIIKAYYYRLKALNIDVNEINIINKLLPLSSEELNNSLSKIMNGNLEEIINILRKLGIPAIDKNESHNNPKEDFKSTTEVEVPNDFMLELENNNEITKIIEEGLNNNLSDEQIVNITNNIIETKHQKFKSIPNLRIVLTNLVNKKKNNRGKNSQSNSLGGRQYVLTNNNIPSHTSESYEVA